MFWGVAALGLIGFAVVVDKAFIERMLTIGDVAEVSEDADMSARSRRVILQAQVEMAFDHPAGIGFRGTVPLSPQYLDPQWLAKLDEDGGQAAGRSSHNTFMTAWVEQGIPGLLLFSSLLVWLLAAVVRMRLLGAVPIAYPQVLTLGAAVVGCLVVVYVAGLATDYLLAEVQFWWYAALVSVFWLAQRPALKSPAPVVAPASVSSVASPGPAADVR
jgi:O-antigen ligase